MSGELELLDWRRRIFSLSAEVRAAEPAAGHARWRAVREELFRTHPQSPLDAEGRRNFSGLRYFGYDPALRFSAPVEPRPGERVEIQTSTGEHMAMRRFGVVELPFGTLEVYWIDVYGGGVFIPFRDATSGTTTYGGGRYLLDTIKGADLGSTEAGALVLDFNFAYHPSCHYHHRWSCPLA
ncbi:MAG: DUF1684 domain-containing protein, partial [Chloroflexota bacterium]|nr:DUF1684 domain-containing protein [Chloroflexota bacterium]